MKMFAGLLIGVLSLALTSGSALAADVVKMGFFDMQTIIEHSEIGKEGAEKFRLKKEKMREQLAAKLQEIKEMDEEFKKKEHLLSQDVKKKKAQEILSAKMDYDRLTYEANQKLGDLEQELLAPIKNKVLEIVTRIGKEEGYTLILERRRAGLAYAPSSLELTDRIIRELNEMQVEESAGSGQSRDKRGTAGRGSDVRGQRPEGERF